MIRTEILGLRTVQVTLEKTSPEIQTELRVFVADRMLALRDGVKNNIARMFQSTGPLWQAVQATMVEVPGGVSGVVFIDGSRIPYAAIQEEGGQTRAHDIRPKKPGGALAFQFPGRMGFSGGPKQSSLMILKVVHHPGSRIPEHPYMRLALVKEKPVFEGGIRAIVEKATKL
jgi:hypothetical protein